MAHILVITGLSDSGKTATAHRIYNHLMRGHDFDPHYVYYGPIVPPFLIGGKSISNGDFMDVLYHNPKNKKVGIVSQGDYSRDHYNKNKNGTGKPYKNSVIAHINHLISKGCEIIICCASLNAHENIKKNIPGIDLYQEVSAEFPHPNRVIPFSKSQINNESMRDADEDNVAKQVINYLKTLLSRLP